MRRGLASTQQACVNKRVSASHTRGTQVSRQPRARHEATVSFGTCLAKAVPRSLKVQGPVSLGKSLMRHTLIQ